MSAKRITREQAEACVEQVKLMFHGYREESGFGKPVAVEQPDCWHLAWADGPFRFGTNLARDVAHGSPGVPPRRTGRKASASKRSTARRRRCTPPDVPRETQ